MLSGCQQDPDKTELITFGSKRQRDKLKACFPIDILGNPLCPVESVKKLGVWFHSDFLLVQTCSECLVVLYNSMTSDMSGGFLL